jgi:NADH dehydrogenase FAD-containing subunit
VEAASIFAESMDAIIYIIEARELVPSQFSPQTSVIVEKALLKKGLNILTSTALVIVREDAIKQNTEELHHKIVLKVGYHDGLFLPNQY